MINESLEAKCRCFNCSRAAWRCSN